MRRKVAAEGGCGVIGLACSEPVAGRHLLNALVQMRNRGNGKGGGAAMVGLDPQSLGVSPELLRRAYLFTVAYLDPSARREVEDQMGGAGLHILHTRHFEPRADHGLNPPPPGVVVYFAQVGEAARRRFAQRHGVEAAPREMVEGEWFSQLATAINSRFYASLGDKRAFVLSFGKDILALKLVGYGDDVFHAYGLEEVRAHIWIGHHRYPTKGRVWHPGGAHPFVALDTALVHNGDFANYASICSYLEQFNLQPQFLTDTEVAVQVFDLLYRTFGYPLEYVIEALAPTTERDFALLPEAKQRLYRRLQRMHIHASPDGPWFFLIAQSAQAEKGLPEARLIGITDTSMLRPQVFALQHAGGAGPSIGLAASERQAIDAALLSLAQEDDRFWRRPDMVWNARGGSHTDGGAFIFRVLRDGDGGGELVCSDKFGRRIEIEESSPPYRRWNTLGPFAGRGAELPAEGEERVEAFIRLVAAGDYDPLRAFLGRLSAEPGRREILQVFARLMDRHYPTGQLRRSVVLAMIDQAFDAWVAGVRERGGEDLVYHHRGARLPAGPAAGQGVLLDALDYPPQGPDSLAIEIRRLVESGFRYLAVVRTRGHRFIGSGLSTHGRGTRIEVFGSSGDYLASGLNEAHIVVHGSGQDQLAQIMKSGKLVVHGDVGQTFMYGAKGGEAYVLGNAAGRPLINAVGRPRVVINGTCLDYLAESFMAGDVLNGGGFVILNGVRFNAQGEIVPLSTPYPGGNLFALASGGAIFVRDPYRLLGEDQLNGGAFAELEPRHWRMIKPYLEENERLFGIPLEWLLTVDGLRRRPEEVYRLVVPSKHRALQAEEAWVRHGA